MVNSCLAFQKCVAQMLCYREKIVSVFMKFKKVHWTSTFKAHCLLRVRKNTFHCFFFFFVIFKYNSIHEFARKCLYNSKVIFKNVSHTIRVKWLADWLILLKKCEKENRSIRIYLQLRTRKLEKISEIIHRCSTSHTGIY